jgi:hypothetical protein
MPSGHTCKIATGMNFKEFAIDCGKAFGANIMLRDSPRDTEIPVYEPSQYNLECLERSEKKLAKFLELSDEDLQKLLDEEYTETVRGIISRNEESNILRKKYENILEQVNEFVPPTEEHIHYKEFMQTQLVDSIRFDCHISEIPEKSDLNSWKAENLEWIRRDISYHTKGNLEEIGRTNARNKWNSDLFEALDKIS